MNLKREFNRIEHLFHNGVDKTQKATSDWAGKQASEAAGMARQLRRQVDTGTRSLITAEEALVRHVRANPALYLMGTALVFGALVAKLFIQARQSRQAPIL